MNPDRGVTDDVESNTPSPSQLMGPATSRPNDSSEGGEAKQAFFRMMSEWFSDFVRMNSAAQQPPPLQAPVVPQVIDLIRLNKPSVDKIRKYRAEEFRATVDDDAEQAEFWLENTIRVFDAMSLTPDECIKCAVSLLRDTTYNWWKTLILVVLRERITWDFFQKKYISQRFIDQKRKEFLELKQGRMSVTEYEREFERECVSTEATMCKRFIEGLNKDIKLLVRILDINEFVVLVERACKAEELIKEKEES
ncbi:Protein MCM10 [Gossypium australe]|uniref:Protein MCM10 n=1 Tax=Gossypium australe TaxID=47621 RepID=A0A5B6WTG8_9ROSI|nr:Protein MCM10 [Gossypium australe]